MCAGARKKIPPLGRLLLSQRENTQSILQPSAAPHLSQLLFDLSIFHTLQQHRSKFAQLFFCFFKKNSACRFHDLSKASSQAASFTVSPHSIHSISIIAHEIVKTFLLLMENSLTHTIHKTITSPCSFHAHHKNK